MKQTLKQEIFQKRKSLTKQEVKEKSLKIKENLYSLNEFKKAKNIMFYVSFNNEAGTREAIKELLAKNAEKSKILGSKASGTTDVVSGTNSVGEKTIVVPYVMENYPILQLSELKNFDWLEPRTFGVLEPKELYIREFNHEKLDLVIVPGIVFDKKGYRIGYGHGYYDRFLKIVKNVKKIGLAFELQLVDKIPEEGHDVPVDVIVTEKRVLKCSGK